jgi:ATP-binding cassette subfamily C protein CydC
LTLVGVLLAVGWLAERGVIAPRGRAGLAGGPGGDGAVCSTAPRRRGGRAHLAGHRRLAPQVVQAPVADTAAPAAARCGGRAGAGQRPAPGQSALGLGSGEPADPGRHAGGAGGASGAGKSTLLSLMAGELPATRPCGRAARHLADPAHRAVPGQPARQPAAGLPGASDERLWQALEDAGLASDVRAMAQGLDTGWARAVWACPAGRRAAWRWPAAAARRRAGCWTSDRRTGCRHRADVLACLQRQMKGTP